jgi:hypothetical protein
VYSIEDARKFLAKSGVDVEAVAPLVEGRFMSAFIRATKPGAAKPEAAKSGDVKSEKAKPAGGCCSSGCCG